MYEINDTDLLRCDIMPLAYSSHLSLYGVKHLKIPNGIFLFGFLTVM